MCVWLRSCGVRQSMLFYFCGNTEAILILNVEGLWKEASPVQPALIGSRGPLSRQQWHHLSWWCNQDIISRLLALEVQGQAWRQLYDCVCGCVGVWVFGWVFECVFECYHVCLHNSDFKFFCIHHIICRHYWKRQTLHWRLHSKGHKLCFSLSAQW